MNPKHIEVSPLMARLCSYIAGAVARSLPPPVLHKGRAHLLDTVAAMISGSQLRPGEQGIDYVRRQGGAPEAMVVTTDIVTTAGNAAFANGMLAHADETDDSHKASRSHLGCSVVPAALAMAEREAASGEALLRAVVLGYDIGARVLLALNPLPFHQAGHCTHAFAGVFGSAAASAALADLTPEQVGWALSYAAQQAAGITSWRRAVEHVEKAFVFAGMPARSGVSAAAMVAAGFTGVNDVFTGAQNFFITFGQEPQPELLVEELGDRFEILNTTIKKWSVGSPVQSVLDATQALMKSHRISPNDVAEVLVRMNPVEIDTVNDRAMPDINLQHLVSVLLVDGDLSFASSHDEARMRDPAVLALKCKVSVQPDPALERRRARVTITTLDKHSISHHATAVRGTPENPMGDDEVIAKAADLTIPVLGESRSRQLVDAIWRIDRLDNIRSLRPLLGFGP
jgi:2-methylcitrate dehydratase PrpD